MKRLLEIKATNASIPPGRIPDCACAAGAVSRSRARAVLILAAAALAAVAPVLSARSQGSIDIDNNQSTGRLCLYQPGNYYGGVYGVEVWMVNTDRLPPGINIRNPP